MPRKLFPKGKSGNPNGRPKGSENKITKEIKTVKATVLEAFHELQKHPKANLVAWGQRNPSQFYQVAAKLIPTEVTGAEGGDIIIKVVRV